jgi:hypothetical protein
MLFILSLFVLICTITKHVFGFSVFGLHCQWLEDGLFLLITAIKSIRRVYVQILGFYSSPEAQYGSYSESI